MLLEVLLFGTGRDNLRPVCCCRPNTGAPLVQTKVVRWAAAPLWQWRLSLLFQLLLRGPNLRKLPAGFQIRLICSFICLLIFFCCGVNAYNRNSTVPSRPQTCKSKLLRGYNTDLINE